MAAIFQVKLNVNRGKDANVQHSYNRMEQDEVPHPNTEDIIDKRYIQVEPQLPAVPARNHSKDQH